METTSSQQTFSNRQNAVRAARKELGAEAKADRDFEIFSESDRFVWRPIEAKAAGGQDLFNTVESKEERAEPMTETTPGDDPRPAFLRKSHEARTPPAPAVEPAQQEQAADNEAPKAQANAPKRKKPKAGSETRERKGRLLIALLRCPEGVTVSEVCDRFEWLPHTARAAISTGSRKAGLTVSAEKVEGRGRVYRAA